MITFTHICVALVITALIGGAVFIWGSVMTKMTDKNIDSFEGATFWGFLVSTLGFGICLTTLLYQNGIIK